ncbi:DUF6192 family protein [Kitasatospora sp. NPDC089509]|uniref:DUF6192 family protein n=1 Tax=Kitasatospora sp. NPDC089509 TaxID=3364079 RepID=UPI003812DEEB
MTAPGPCPTPCPPRSPCTRPPEGTARWTPDEAKRQVAKPVAPQEKVSSIHSLAKDEEVAATVTGDFLRRPAVVAQVEPEGKVRVVEEPTRDDHVAAQVTTGLLRRPDVAARAMADDCPDYWLAARAQPSMLYLG